MEILYISPKRFQELQSICSLSLLINVLEGFTKKHDIIISNNNKHPSGLWVINSFLKEPSVHRINKIRVIVAFAFCGGFFEFSEGNTTFGDTNVLHELLSKNCITKNEYAFYTHKIFEARQNIKPLHFTFYNKNTSK